MSQLLHSASHRHCVPIVRPVKKWFQRTWTDRQIDRLTDEREVTEICQPDYAGNTTELFRALSIFS